MEGRRRAEVEKGVEHGSIAPRRKWPKPFLAEGFWPSLPHLSRILQKKTIYRTSTAGPMGKSLWNIFLIWRHFEIYSVEGYGNNVCYIFLHRIKSFCGSANHQKFLLWIRFSRWNPHFITLENSFYILTRIWFLSEKISIMKRIQPFCKTNNFPLLNKYFKMKTTCWYIEKNPSAEG